MNLITLRKVCVSFGGPLVLDGVDLRIETGERVCLVGRNGEGKSTLLKLISGELNIDDGEIIKTADLAVSSLSQQVPRNLIGSIYDVVATGLGSQGALLAQYHHLIQLDSGDTSHLSKLEHIQHELESNDGWKTNQRVDTILTRLQLDADVEFANLSGGLKRRVLLAKALVSDPDLLLLDEPTNHLDLDAIIWLEEFLLNYRGTILFITHDRSLIKKLATRIVDLDRGKITSWPGDYEAYLRHKQETLDAENMAQQQFDKKLSAEERWIRQGIKARRTRNEGRVRSLKLMRDKRSQRRARAGQAQLRVNASEASGKIVVEAENVSFAYDDKAVIQNFSTVILRGDKVGIIGPNGVGKSTLLQLLLTQLSPQSGEIKLGTKIEVAYFDQHRSQINEQKSVLDNVAEGSDTVTVNGKSQHIIGYLQDFLFSPARTRTPVRALSGGERNRLMLAKLFTKPANLLVMDEPTNDLDVETLELLEELLLNYQGTLFLVSHDRTFINNIVSSTLVFEGQGRVREYVGGYDDWMRQRRVSIPEKITNAKAKSKSKITNSSRKGPTKLSYKDQRELEALPAKIEDLEYRQQQLHTAMADAKFFQRDKTEIAADQKRLQEIEKTLAETYQRWEALE
ncbi:ATP-binding cassette domain-containing protein [Pseudomonadota bacterium]